MEARGTPELGLLSSMNLALNVRSVYRDYNVFTCKCLVNQTLCFCFLPRTSNIRIKCGEGSPRFVNTFDKPDKTVYVSVVQISGNTVIQ